MTFFSKPGPEAARRSMVAKQLKQRGIVDPRVLAALSEVPRERFVAEPLSASAYADRALPIECGQTISQPFIVALMSQALQLSGTEHVLEIGTGSGYQTAVLSRLARRVTSVERHEQLSQQAAARLAECECTNVTLVVGDGSQGHSAADRYDRIIVTAAAAEMPAGLWEQLAEGGILVIPIGDSRGQDLQAITKESGQPRATSLCKCRFVPLIGENEPRQEGDGE